jgi:hypothetical protein
MWFLSVSFCTFTFSFKGSSLWLLFGTSELPSSLLLHFGVIIKYRLHEHKHCTIVTEELTTEAATKWGAYIDTLGMLDKGMVRVRWFMPDLQHYSEDVNLNLMNCFFWNFPFHVFELS